VNKILRLSKKFGCQEILDRDFFEELLPIDRCEELVVVDLI